MLSPPFFFFQKSLDLPCIHQMTSANPCRDKNKPALFLKLPNDNYRKDDIVRILVRATMQNPNQKGKIPQLYFLREDLAIQHAPDPSCSSAQARQPSTIRLCFAVLIHRFIIGDLQWAILLCLLGDSSCTATNIEFTKSKKCGTNRIPCELKRCNKGEEVAFCELKEEQCDFLFEWTPRCADGKFVVYLPNNVDEVGNCADSSDGEGTASSDGEGAVCFGSSDGEGTVFFDSSDGEGTVSIDRQSYSYLDAPDLSPRDAELLALIHGTKSLNFNFPSANQYLFPINVDLFMNDEHLSLGAPSDLEEENLSSNIISNCTKNGFTIFRPLCC